MLKRALLAFTFGSAVLAGHQSSGAAQAEFDVVSIKRNSGDLPPAGPTPNPASGAVAMRAVPVVAMLLRGYPLPAPAEFVNLPGWAQSERFDVEARLKPGASLAEQQQMWRALLADRLKLIAHYEPRERPGFNLVFDRSDHKLGPQLTPSTVNCAEPQGPPPEALRAVMFQRMPLSRELEQAAMSRCGSITVAGTFLYAGSIPIDTFIRFTLTPAVRMPITDLTGLTGPYAIKLLFSSSPTPGGADEPLQEQPLIFTAIREQLGLKLELSATSKLVLVIDRIERPSEN